MKKLLGSTVLLILLVIIGGCGGKETSHEDIPEMIHVDLIVPESGKLGVPIELKSVVTQGNEKVDDADEVEYEIWLDGYKDESEMIEAKLDGEGIYTAAYTFHDAGDYLVQVHVTARRMHSMPKKTITIVNE